MTRVSHRSWERAVEACLDGALPAARDVEVRRHLDDCPDCDRYARFLLALRGSLRRVVSRVPPLSRNRLDRLAAHLADPSRSS
jgi:anti-sigma factor RsiW